MGGRKELDAVRILPDVIRRLLSISEPDDLLPEVLGLCRGCLGCEEVSLMLVEPDGRELVEHVVVGAKLKREHTRVRVGSEGITGWAAGKRKTAIVADVRKDSRYVQEDPKRRSEAAVPILLGDRLLGVLNFESNKAGYFKATDRAVLEFLAVQVGVALRTRELHAAANGLRNRLGMLNHLSRLSGGFMPTDRYLARVAEETRRALDCFWVGIFQGDYDRQEVVLLGMSSAKPLDVRVGATQRFGQGLIGRAFELGETVNARDVSREKGYIPRLEPAKSELCVPIRVGDHCLGIIDAQATQVGAFGEDDLTVLETLARFLAPSIQAQKATV